MSTASANAPAHAGSRDARPAAVIHVDLDGARHIYRAHGWQYPAIDDALFRSGIRRLFDLLEKWRIRATLFVIAEDLRDDAKRSLILEARDRGHELASHSSTHRHLTDLAGPDRVREVVDSKREIEAAAGAEVLGFRAPGYVLDETTLSLVAEAGYRYDSSMFIGTRRPAGGSCARTAAPYRPFPDRALVEMPLPGYAGLPLPFHPSYTLLLGLQYFRLGLQRFLSRHDATFVLLLHLTDLSDPLGGASLSGLGSRLYTLSVMSSDTKLRRLERILEEVSRRCVVTNTSSVLASISARDEAGS
ncbi:MAG: polysaccharide deacetylase family protein [Gemmatimonadota bacterium]|nr:polysaccharide deacetylase family protein [Gemmatimonadota bacterium]